MFSIVPQNFCSRNSLSPESIASFVTGSSKLLVPGKVTAATTIPQGTESEPLEAASLAGRTDVVQISAEVNSSGKLELVEKCKEVWCGEVHWARALRLSDDCHSYNVQLKFQSAQNPEHNLSRSGASKLVLYVVRPIDPGQELLLWFSEDILAILQIAFLTPANIQGQKRYVCTKCSALYESPNPLKLHISLSCGRYTISSLWEKLSNSVKETVIVDEDVFDFKLSPEHPGVRQRSAMDLSMSSSTQTIRPESIQKRLYRPYTEPSAFKPFRKFEDNHLLAPVDNVSMWPIIPFDRNSYQLPPIANNEEEAHIETLVSSLGKSKQGHVCLYCGKCYSRKYGLKIHIRTHTGYKPLKCKFCMRPFGDPSNLNKHVRLHAEGNTPYKCDLCGKVLVRRRDLERHLKSRHMLDMHPDSNILQEDPNVEDKSN